MRKGVQAIEVTKRRGETVVSVMGRTSRGVKFIIDQKAVGKDHPSRKKLKEEIAKAADELLNSEA